MNLVFAAHSWLWLLWLVPLFWFLPHRPAHRAHAAIRSILAALLILALARPALITQQDRDYQVVIWDRSESVGVSTAAGIEALAERLSASSRVRIVTLNGAGEEAPALGRFEPVNLAGSSVSRGLAVAARLIPEGAVGAITLVGDGMATDQHWGDAVRQLVERKIPVHTVKAAAPGNDVCPTAIRTRPPLRVGQTTIVTVDVMGSAGHAVVSLWAGDERLAQSAPMSLLGRTSVELSFEPARAGFLEVTAEVRVATGSDINPGNNRFISTLAVQDPVRVLYLAERLTGSREKMSRLVGAGVDLSAPTLAQLKNLAGNPQDLAAYDLVVIDDRPAEAIPRPVQEAIVKAVKEDGAGLFYAGGKGVYGTGGYFDTPLASVLPVEMVQKEEKRDPSTTLVVIIDTSGSMSGERVQLAKECARLAIRRLLPHDKVGIVEFYGTKQWAAPIQSAANGIDIQRAINRLDAGGGTVILPAIEEAFYALQNVRTRYKHVLVLTDGGVESGDFESLMRRMAAKGINVSTVLVGSDAHSEFLVNLANWGKGHFYCASNRFSIPEVLLKQPSTSKIPPYRPGMHLISMGGTSGWWGGIPRPEAPTLSGYVETRIRPGAQVTIETATERHPILASWRYGLGRVSAFTTEPVGGGTAPWREWEGYGAWLLRVLARTAREHPQPFSYTLARYRTHARIVARRLTLQPFRPRVEHLNGDALPERLVFQQRSPDVFTATVLADAGETIRLRAGAEDWPGSMDRLVSPAWHAQAPERNVDPAGAVDLSLLASTTGGGNMPLENLSGLEPAAGGMGTAKDLFPLGPWCLLLGLLAYFLDLLYRRRPGSTASGANTLGLTLLMMGLPFIQAADVSAADALPGLSAALESRLQEALKKDPFSIDHGPLYTAALMEDRALEPLLSRLDAIIQQDEASFEAIWLAASLNWRYGNLDAALQLFEKAAAIKATPLALYRVAQLMDAGGRTGDAVTQYLKTLEAKPDEAMAGRIQLRLALLKSTGAAAENLKEDLAAYAKERDQAFRNRAGVVLALAGKPKEALTLYKAAEEGKQAFKQLIRIAEWAMAAGDLAKAQEASWDALQAAGFRRDRRYALTVLAESYRREKKLDRLIQRFEAASGLSAEARMAWIDLLRELGDADRALALFQEEGARDDGGDGFTADMRRRLLEVCREAGRDDLLIKNFRTMIAEEPRRLEWRLGLSRFHLERGERSKGEAVWTDYQAQAKRGDWLAAAGAAMDLGLDGIAQGFAENLIRDGRGKERMAALQFLFDLHKARGREDEMKEVLSRMDALAAPDASERAQLAESWEQLGRQDKAAQVLENLRAARGPGNISSDLETRLAWLHSETGAEEKAYEAWKRAWLRIDSPGRRRYIEDRLMATASRLGKLADIAIELEEKLLEGTADKRDSALLVRLYTKVGDPVSASEIIHDFMKQSGGGELQMLEEQARVYVMCNDYYHYEKTLRRLMKLDPEGTPEYLTQLAMSALERGRNDEARAILTEMRNLKQNPASAEFEAGVLKIAGMHEEAAGAYWRGIAGHPDRIDAYLLLGRALQTLGKGQQAIGIFQYLVENADRDDLFTIAVDGLLNMNNPRQGLRLTPDTLRWARRAILERLAGKDDKVYLFQLVSDVSEDLRDGGMMMRALAETLPIAGERRTAQLRELMELARAGVGAVGYSRMRGTPKDREGMLRFGRRLIGIGEAVPPQVYLDLGANFLDTGDVRNAVKTFEKANDDMDHGGYRRKVADAFEHKRYLKSALRSYEKLLVAEPGDVGLLVKVGELKEQLGREQDAAIAYRRALDLLVEGQPLFSFKENKAGSAGPRYYYYSRNVDQFDKYYLRVLTGFLAAGDSGGKACLSLIDHSLAALKADLARVKKEGADAADKKTLTLGNVPRIARRSRLIRRLALAYGYLEKARAMEALLLRAFPEDKTLLAGMTRAWDGWGYNRHAWELVKAAPENPGKEAAEKVLGHGTAVGLRHIFQSALKADQTGTGEQLRQLDELLGETWSAPRFNALFSAARCLKNTAAIERLARYAISRTPKNRRLVQSVQLLPRVLPCLDEAQRSRLVSYVKGLIQRQDEEDMNTASYYYYQRLKQLTGEEMKLPARMVRPKVNQLLARGGHYLRSVASLFNLLSREEYPVLLRETYRKAKSSDRLSIVFSLIRQYPGKLDATLEGIFVELAEEAALDALEDPLKIYQASTRASYYQKPSSDNAGFEARLLEKLAEAAPDESRMPFHLEQAQQWHRAGDEEQGLAAAGKAFSLALEEEKTFRQAQTKLRAFPPVYLDAFLASMDRAEKENGKSVDLENKRILLCRQARTPGRVLTVLRESIKKFPGESAFRVALRKELEKEGRHHEAIQVLEGLVKLEPDNQQHGRDLQAAWNRLSHPIKARNALKKDEAPRPDAPAPTPAGRPVKTPAPPQVSVKRAVGPAGTAKVAVQVVASHPSNPPAKTTDQGAEKGEDAEKSEGDSQEKPVARPSMQLLKKYCDAGETDAARLCLRRLWRQFSALDQASRNPYYRRPRMPHRHYFNWPGKSSRPATKAAAPSPEAALGGLKAFLAMGPVASLHARPTSSYIQPAQSQLPSLFSVKGAEAFVAREMAVWLQTMEPQDYQGFLFEEMLKETVKQRMAKEGVEPYLNAGFARYKRGEMSILDQHALLTALALQPEAGGEAATSFLNNLLDTLDPADLWKMVRLARCFVRRGEAASALSLYRWCAANTGYARHVSYGTPTVSANVLVDEIRSLLKGEDRIRALDTVLQLVTPAGSHVYQQHYFYQFVLTTWAQELAPADVYKHCPDICRQVVRDYPTSQYRSPGGLELATLFLAAGGSTEEALEGLKHVLMPPAGVRTASSHRSRQFNYILQQWLPEDMTAWTHADQWLSGVSRRVLKWAADRELPTVEAVKILTLTAVRQHQNGFDHAARATLNGIRKLPLTHPEAAVWLMDAAAIAGHQALALEVATGQLKERRLPIVRVAEVMASVAEHQGLPAALKLAEETLDYTWEPRFLKTMVQVCTDAKDQENARRWRDRYQQVKKPEPPTVSSSRPAGAGS